MTPLATHRESSPGLRREFVLYEDRVTVTGRKGGNDFVIHVPLEQLCPEIGTFHFRHRRFRQMNLCLFFLGLAIAAEVSLTAALPTNAAMRDQLVVLIAASVIAALAIGLWSLAYWPRYTAYRFVNTGGVVVLDAFASGRQSEQCREFAEQVSKAIRQARGMPTAASVHPRA